MVVNPVADAVDSLSNMAGLREENAALRNENAELLASIILVHDQLARLELLEQLYDLETRGGLRTAFPKPLDGTFTFDFNVQQAAVNEILKRVAKAGGLELEFRNRTAVFWKPAEEAELRALEILVKADRPAPGRARALEDLAQLSDCLL